MRLIWALEADTSDVYDDGTLCGENIEKPNNIMTLANQNIFVNDHSRIGTLPTGQSTPLKLHTRTNTETVPLEAPAGDRTLIVQGPPCVRAMCSSWADKN